jgi:molecular chaperone DnaK (HSP70)
MEIRALHINTTLGSETFEKLIEPAVDRSFEIFELAMKDAGTSVKISTVWY